MLDRPKTFWKHVWNDLTHFFLDLILNLKQIPHYNTNSGYSNLTTLLVYVVSIKPNKYPIINTLRPLMKKSNTSYGIFYL